MAFVPVTGAGREHRLGVHADLAGDRAQLADDLLGGRPLRRLVPRHRDEQAAERGRQVRRDVRRAVQARDGGLEGVPRVLATRGDALQQHQPERVDVGRGPDRLSADLLRGEVRRGPDDHAGRGDVRGVGQDGDAEVRQVGASLGVEQDVARLDVAVHDAVAVHVGEGVRQCGTEGDHVTEAQRAAADAVGEGLALDELHHEVGAAALLADVVDRHQTGVVHPRERLYLALPAGLVGLADARREQLHRDVAAEQLVARAIDLRGAAATDEVAERVPARAHGGRGDRLRRTHRPRASSSTPPAPGPPDRTPTHRPGPGVRGSHGAVSPYAVRRAPRPTARPPRPVSSG